MIATEEENALKFQDGLKPYLKNKISILKLSVYSEVVDRAIIAEKVIRSFSSTKSNKGREVGVIVPMIAKHKKCLFQLRVRLKGK